MTQSLWPSRLTAVIASQVQRLRAGKMSAQQLSDATAELGHPLARSVIANLESGRRDVVSVAELLVLARALGVPPVLLIFPLGHEPLVEVLPDTKLPTWQAARWFVGDDPFPGSGDDVEESPVAYFREQDRLLSDWQQARRSLAEARAKTGGAGWDTPTERPDLLGAHLMEVQYLEGAVRAIEAQLRRHRTAMRRFGLDPGALPAELSHVEDGAELGQR